MRKRLLWLAAALCAFATGTAAQAFEGRYQISGSGMNGSLKYEGVAQIKQTGDTYTVLWKIDEVVYLGTGILRADVLSVVFLPINARTIPGVASLRVVDDHVTGGSWTGVGTTDVIQEQWTPVAKGEAL
jgi:hypothetical protein